MTILFSDSFVDAGSPRTLNGHVPDNGSGSGWTSGDSTLYVNYDNLYATYAADPWDGAAGSATYDLTYLGSSRPSTALVSLGLFASGETGYHGTNKDQLKVTLNCENGTVIFTLTYRGSDRGWTMTLSGTAITTATYDDWPVVGEAHRLDILIHPNNTVSAALKKDLYDPFTDVPENHFANPMQFSTTGAGAIGKVNSIDLYLQGDTTVKNILYATDPLGSGPGSATLALTSPSPQVFIGGGIRAALTAPAMKAAVTFAVPTHSTIDVKSPPFKSAATATFATSAQGFAGSMPSPNVSARGGANVVTAMGSAKASAQATAYGKATASLSVPKAVVAAQATATKTWGMALKGPAATISARGGANIRLTLTNGWNVDAHVASGCTAEITTASPMFAVALTGRISEVGRIVSSMPMPTLGRTGRITASLGIPKVSITATRVVPFTTEAYAVNLRHVDPQNETDEVTHFTGFPFTHIVRHLNEYYGVGPSGVFRFGGATDDGADIAYDVETAKTDFGEVNLKTVAAAYLGGRIGSAQTVKLIAGETTPETYAFTTPRSDKAQSYRQVFGRGVKSRYYALGVSGVDEFQLDSIDAEVNKLSRRI